MRIFTSLIFIVLFIISCEDAIENSLEIWEAPISVQRAYVENNLLAISKELEPFVNDPVLREMVYVESGKKFDGESNVLIEVLLERAKAMKANLNYEKIDKHLNAFKNIDGENFYPQIYIPNRNVIEFNQTAARIENVDEPILVIFDGDDHQNEFNGYEFNDSNELVITDNLTVDEEYATNNETWVISLNESVQNDCDIKIILNDEQFDSTRDNCDSRSRATGTSGTTGTQSSASAIVDGLTVLCHNESWAAGASEIHILMLVHDYAFYSAELNLYGNDEFEGGRIAKIRRKDIKNLWYVDTNFYILNDWLDRAPDMPYGSYVIFEYDTWPTGKKTVKWYKGGEVEDHEYRSADEAYDFNTFYQSSFSGTHYNYPCIEWLGQYQ